MQVYFISHRYDGQQLWQLQGFPGIHEFVWLSSFISFIFLYPSTFNLLEVAAIDKPKVHLWETGIMRITRHPQVLHRIMRITYTLVDNFFTSTRGFKLSPVIMLDFLLLAAIF